MTRRALDRGIHADYADHMKYWDNYYAQSSVSLPDTVLQKQYDNEMYKFGSASRPHSSPISLQAVWTADNGLLPPWKGDYHHDLNTQLSYWPAYTGNHLDEGLGYLNTLWNQRDTYKKYTRTYFGTDGMNVPGVCTLDGKPLGGWIQYSMSPTVGAWLGQHFYLHWKYSADSAFLAQRAYPFMKDIATYLEQISAVDDKGVRRLPISSSPEVFDNSIDAWFSDMTNYDTALMKFAFNAAGIQEMLLQSHTGVIRVFPAIRASWDNVGFDNLRAMGAFLVSARKTDGTVSNITVRSEKGAQLRIAIPKGHSVTAVNGAEVSPAAITAAPSLPEANGLLALPTKPGDTIALTLRAD